jgi:hypothetical protein
MKAMRLVLEMFKMAGYFLDRPCTWEKRKSVPSVGYCPTVLWSFDFLAQSLYQVHFLNFPEIMFSVRNLAGRMQPNYQRKPEMINALCT